MTSENGDGVEVAEATEVVSRFILFNVPKDDVEEFREIMKLYGMKGNAAFRAVIDGYNFSTSLGVIATRLEILEQRLKQLEGQDMREKLKTFGGSEK